MTIASMTIAIAIGVRSVLDTAAPTGTPDGLGAGVSLGDPPPLIVSAGCSPTDPAIPTPERTSPRRWVLARVTRHYG